MKMKKMTSAIGKRTVPAKGKARAADEGLLPLVAEVRNLIQSARHRAATVVNTLQVLTNFEIGRCIVEHEQKGKHRAAYGTELVKGLSSRLTKEFGKPSSLSGRAKKKPSEAVGAELTAVRQP